MYPQGRPIPLAEPDLSGREAEYLLDCVKTNYVSSVGPYVTRFEEAVAQSCGAPGAVSTSSGTAGLHLALVCAGVRHGDLVILPSFTFIASANSISHCGASPWLMDIERESWNLDAGLLEAELQRNTERKGDALLHKPSGRRVAALMPVYTLGTPADMERISDVARRYRLPMVVDAAAALGATYQGRPLAGLADMTVFSFNGNKTVTSGGGGAIVSTDKALLTRAKHLAAQARKGEDYLHDDVGYNYRMTNVEAAVGLAQIERLDRLIERKRQIRETYNREFVGIPGLGPFPTAVVGSACWLSGLVLDEDSRLSPAKLRDALRDQGISAGLFWRPVHLQPPYAKSPASSQNVAESLWPRILVLPCSTSLDAAGQQCVIAKVREHLLEPTRA
jgi:dTDP-4-amino-4,6-dideoxygalactose transaminase